MKLTLKTVFVDNDVKFLHKGKNIEIVKFALKDENTDETYSLTFSKKDYLARVENFDKIFKLNSVVEIECKEVQIKLSEKDGKSFTNRHIRDVLSIKLITPGKSINDVIFG